MTIALALGMQRMIRRHVLIRKLAAGLYTWLPLGLRVLRKVEAIVREEMDATGAQEVSMPVVQPAELWEESGRWEQYGPLLLRMQDRHERNFCFGPTHEEVITDIARRELRSYKQLPINFYQIQTKFRDEIRPRFGVMRAREFLMKDAYSFHIDAASLDETYWEMYEVRLGVVTTDDRLARQATKAPSWALPVWTIANATRGSANRALRFRAASAPCLAAAPTIALPARPAPDARGGRGGGGAVSEPPTLSALLAAHERELVVRQPRGVDLDLLEFLDELARDQGATSLGDFYGLEDASNDLIARNLLGLGFDCLGGLLSDRHFLGYALSTLRFHRLVDHRLLVLQEAGLDEEEAFLIGVKRLGQLDRSFVRTVDVFRQNHFAHRVDWLSVLFIAPLPDAVGGGRIRAHQEEQFSVRVLLTDRREGIDRVTDAPAFDLK